VGKADLTTECRSALVLVLACGCLFAATDGLAAKTRAQKDESSSTASAKHEQKSAHRTSKKSSAEHKEKEHKGKKSKSAKGEAGRVPVPNARPSSLPASIGTRPTVTTPREVGEDSDQRATVPLERGPTFDASQHELSQVKRAIDALRHSGAARATEIAAGISDPLARKLVEWIILRSENGDAASARYIAFIAANPSWPNLGILRRHAEARLWTEHAKPAQVLSFFDDSPPQSAPGRLALARALLAQGDSEGARAHVRHAWRNDSMSADLEAQVLNGYSELLTRTDHKARVENRLSAADNESALRAARRLGIVDTAIAQVRIALNKNGSGARKLLGAVPAEAHQEAGYILAHAHILRHENKAAQAAQVLLSAPPEIAEIHDPEEWWVERRVLSRQLLDIDDPKSAYLAVRDAAEPAKENSRVERHFMAGWIALRFLHDPARAATHFARIMQVSAHPTSRARAHYWLARAAEAAHQPEQARAEYQAAARSSAAYYGQLARARLGLAALALAPPAARDGPAGREQRELVGAMEMLYALNERPLVINAMADLGNKLDDIATLTRLGQLAEKHQDARAMLQLGKAALARGLPLDYYAFPTVSVPSYSPIGPRIDAAVLFAIIRQESAFDPDDWSAAHAMGLMQVTPVAARDTCKRFGCTYDVKRLKHDTPYNLQLGAAELGGVMQEYGGNCILAFAAYNAGRGRVSEWIERFGDPRDPKVDPIDWVERIPFMETRNYVQRVMENMQVYRARFGAKVPFAIEADMRGGSTTR
jgi:soluble lytic murein transglycosylase